MLEHGRMVNTARPIAYVLEISLSKLFRGLAKQAIASAMLMGGDLTGATFQSAGWGDDTGVGWWLGRFLVPTPTGAELHQCMFQALAVRRAIVGL